MSQPLEHGGRRGIYFVAAATAVLMVVGAVLIALGARGASGPPPPPVASGGAEPGNASPASPPKTPGDTTNRAPSSTFGRLLRGSAPVQLDIPALQLHSTTIIDLALASDGAIEVPTNPDNPGWFTPGPSPGQLGPAVIAGHVDSVDGPAVFYRLSELRKGDTARVTRADGSIAVFTIDRVEIYDKASFPTHEVYGKTTDRSELRLITCGGGYDQQAGYLSNVVAFGHLTAAAHLRS